MVIRIILLILNVVLIVLWTTFCISLYSEGYTGQYYWLGGCTIITSTGISIVQIQEILRLRKSGKDDRRN